MDNVNTSLNVVIENESVCTIQQLYTAHIQHTCVTRKCVESTAENITQYNFLCTTHSKHIHFGKKQLLNILGFLCMVHYPQTNFNNGRIGGQCSLRKNTQCIECIDK